MDWGGVLTDGGEMAALVRRARAGGVRTALLSNAWGDEYSRDGWDELFDVVVVSGDVGMRKPEARIYRHTAAELALEPSECVFVDDLRVNVLGAVHVGFVGVHHSSYARTAVELEAIFGRSLRG